MLLQVFTQVSLVLLLWGTMCGGLALISDVGYILVQKLTTDQGYAPPNWLNGRTCMTAVALFVLFPLCLQRHMREVGAPLLHTVNGSRCSLTIPVLKLTTKGAVSCSRLIAHC